jgi:hypothetical protein
MHLTFKQLEFYLSYFSLNFLTILWHFLEFTFQTLFYYQESLIISKVHYESIFPLEFMHNY